MILRGYRDPEIVSFSIPQSQWRLCRKISENRWSPNGYDLRIATQVSSCGPWTLKTHLMSLCTRKQKIKLIGDRGPGSKCKTQESNKKMQGWNVWIYNIYIIYISILDTDANKGNHWFGYPMSHSKGPCTLAFSQALARPGRRCRLVDHPTSGKQKKKNIYIRSIQTNFHLPWA